MFRLLQISYGKLNMQPLVDKLRSADMVSPLACTTQNLLEACHISQKPVSDQSSYHLQIVREMYSSKDLCKDDPNNPMPYMV